VKVGDVLRIKDDEIIPADCIIITSDSRIMDTKVLKAKKDEVEVGLV